eukprot:4436250-Karenia_brevis.AAC.1
MPCLPTSVQSLLDQVMVSLLKPLTRSQQVAYQNERLVIKTTKFTGHSSLRCKTALAALASHVHDTFVQAVVAFAPFPLHSHDNGVICFTCPHGHPRAAKTPFDPYNMNKLVFCTQCSKGYVGRHWDCPCGYEWATCHLHFCHPYLASSASDLPKKRAAPRTFTAAQ